MTGFLSLSTVGIFGRIILCCGGSAIHCKMLSDIPKAASSQVTIIQNVCQHCQMPPRVGKGAKLPHLENHCSMKAGSVTLLFTLASLMSKYLGHSRH